MNRTSVGEGLALGLCCGVAVGLCCGVALGAAMQSVGVGIAFGVGLAVAFATAFGASNPAVTRPKILRDTPLPHPLGLFERDKSG